MKDKIKFIAIFASLAIALTALSIFLQTKLTLSIPKITVYRAVKSISIGEMLMTADLQPIQIDLTQRSSDYITDLSQSSNMVAKQVIYKGEIVNRNRLISKSDPSYFQSDSNHRFSIPTTYIDDPYYSTFKQGDIVDIIFTPSRTNNGTTASKVVLTHVTVVGAINADGNIVTSGASSKSTAILFQSSTDNILNISADKYQGKFSFAMYPLGK
jgi:hypothetical protein